MAVIHANEDTFEKEIQEGVVLVDFWAEWCGPCKMLGPVIDELAEQFDGKVKVVKVDIEQAREVVNRLGIMSIPTLQYYVNGEKQDESVGFVVKEKVAQKLEDLTE